MGTILSYLRRYWPFALAAPLLMMLEVFMDLTLPAIMARIIDDGIAARNMELVLALGLQMLAVTVVAFIGGGGCSVMAAYASTGLGADLRRDLFEKTIRLSHKNLDSLETGNLITRLTNDVSQLEDVSRMMLRIMIRAPLQIVGSLVMALLISPSLSLSFLVLIPALLFSLVIIFKKAYPLFYKVQSRLDHLNNRLRENLAGKRLVKAFVREEYEEEKFTGANQELMRTMMKASRAIAFMHPVMQFIMNAGIIIVLWFGARYIDLKVLKVGQLIAFLNYLRQLLFSLMMFSNLLMRFSRAQASSERVQEILTSNPDIMDPANAVSPGRPLTGALRFEIVTFSYSHHADSVLKDLSFNIAPEKTFAVIGATGSGKSSLANLIPRFYECSSGGVFLDNIDIKDLPLDVLRKHIAIAPQQTTLFSGTVRENILYHYEGERVHDPDLDLLMKACAKAADIAGFIETLPAGYESDLNQRGVNLSGGQKQRIAIARALAKKPAVLILDDATSAVDTTTERRILTSLSRLGELTDHDSAPTIIIIAQRISSVMNADTILVLDDGMISGMGTHQELMDKNAIYRDIYQSQIDTGAGPLPAQGGRR
ncbi:MAG: ABC transporter ATP-binding protein [Spirochaetales bacterium]|nr:ABC transporter ATP-binding protein [Spirochaetales bacterium]